MSLAGGTRLGPYQVVSPIGAGGMGEVYKANDTRLDRTVAIKILTPDIDISSDPDRRVRFEREARAISSLSHPHICVLHDVGREGDVDYLVLEHLEGQTLAERLSRGGVMKLAESLRVAAEVADALDAAHRHGIVHRDLKPGNIMLTASGAKLLDFGLAKPLGGAAAVLASAATRADTATAPGTIIGTVQYMAPEQIQGRKADARTDIFALGEIIYEMVTGRRPFEGQTQASVIAKILEVDPPPMSRSARVSSPALDRVVQRCLAKDPDDRWQSARDVLLELRWIQESAGAQEPPALGGQTRGRQWLLGAISAAALLAAAASWQFRPLRGAPERPVVRFDISLPSDISLEDWRGWPVLSPDGRLVVFPVGYNGKGMLAMRRLDDSSIAPIPGTEAAYSPFFSPSGRSLAFFAHGKLQRIELAGGPAATLAEVGAPHNLGGAWSPNGNLLYAPRDDSGLVRVAESGGVPEVVTTLNAARGDIGHVFPQFLPDGKSFLFTVRAAREGGIYVGSLGSTETHRILEDSSHAHYVNPGYVVFQRGRAVLAVPFDARRLEVSGPPFAITDQVFARQYFATVGGDVAYRFDGAISAQLTWYARDGRRLQSVSKPGPYRQIALSPSGRRVAIQSGEVVARGAEADIWMLDLGTGILSRLTTDPALDSDPSWAPDEHKLAFTSNRTGRSALFLKDLTSGRETALFESSDPVVLDEWTPDGKYVVFRSRGRNILALPIPGTSRPLTVIQQETSIQDQSHVSPDGRWIAFNSDESGTWEVYVGAFPDFSNKQQVSTNGGMQPIWGRDGRELFYLSPQGELMAVDIASSDSGGIDSSVPRALFRTPLNPSVQVSEYAVAPDGQRFLFMEPVGGRSQSISWLLNWPAKPR